MPSLWEGLPLALLEAMLAGNAIVASATSGIPEAITAGEEGLLVAPGDAEALADALGVLSAEPERQVDWEVGRTSEQPGSSRLAL